ncbi:hypothetical protein AQUCO_01000539v1 [Aquilegia coerulea]|uniref:Pentatricopeptide repeat-containing protein At3g47840 n=1 Tax=Aquilegia coerulea TaxID=218851 RepID=A0A2G5EAG0_AQUCA|nr:hypothetical protein AQUCO_01000539v1 [Aquilegia coerulea]
MFLLTIRPHIRRLFTKSGISCSTTELLEGIQDQHLNQFGFNAQKIFETNSHMKELVKTGHLQQARNVFDEMPQRDEISWTTIISGYVSAYNASEALVLFSNMRVDSTVGVDPFVLALAFKACGCGSELKYGKLIHGYSVKRGFVNSVFVGSALLDMYTKCGCVEMGCRVFDEMPERNVVSWTAIITGLVRAGFNKEGLWYFSEMWGSDVQCDSYTFASALKACADSGDLKHDYGVRLFERMKIRDVVSWTMIISAYVQMGREELAIQTFLQMRESGVSPNGFTFATVISGCANLGKIVWGEQLHAQVIHLGLLRSMSILNAIMVMYSKCGQLNSSSMVFHGMASRDVVSWTTIVAGYSQDGNCKEAFEHFSWMRREGVKPNEFTLSSLLSVSGNMAILEQGSQLHAHILSIGLEHDLIIKKEASRIFDATGSDSVVSWTAMINGYAEHGHSKRAIELFEDMCRVGMRPDDVTFIGVLSACTHAGLVDKYQINPGKEHYGCIIDLLSRAGRLSDAEQMILSMPFKKDDVVWSSLLTGCRARGDIERGRRAAERILELNPYCATTHITLCNIYSAEGNWKDAAHARKRMRSKGVIKEPGWSWIKVQDEVSAFVAGDRSHPLGEDIYGMLDLLVQRKETAATAQELLP